MGCVYLITSPSGKQYVGQTLGSFESRWRQHVWDTYNGRQFCRALCNAIVKYGPEAFTHAVLHGGIDCQDELNRLEEAEIAAHRTLAPNGYNLLEGGGSRRPSEETRRRISESNKIAQADPVLRAKRSQQSKARWEDPDYREKVTSRCRAAVQTPEHRAKISAAQRLLCECPEERARRSASSKEANGRLDVRAKISASMKQALAAPEVRALISERSKEAMARPEVKAKKSAAAKEVATRPGESARRSARAKEALARPEVKAKLSAAQKQSHARPDVKAKRSASLSRAFTARSPNVFAEGVVYPTQKMCGQAYGKDQGWAWTRINSTSPSWRWWHTIPNHNDPECDAVEECWAIMQWSAANPDHPNVPGWTKRVSSAA